jgi:hypothetical protein
LSNLTLGTPVVAERAGLPGLVSSVVEEIPFSSDDGTHLMSQYVAFTVPSLFPFMDEKVQATLRDMLLSPEGKSHVSRSSTLAHSAALRAVGLKRYGLSPDVARDDSAMRWRSEAVRAINVGCQEWGVDLETPQVCTWEIP